MDETNLYQFIHYLSTDNFNWYLGSKNKDTSNNRSTDERAGQKLRQETEETIEGGGHRFPCGEKSFHEEILAS